MPQDLPTSPTPAPKPVHRSLLSRLIDSYNPGVTFLVAVWVLGYAIRDQLDQRGMLGDTADDALTSLLFVVPIMLLGWGLLTVLQRLTGTRFSDREED